MSELIVRRANVSWQDRIRDYRVCVDGTEVARVANGAEVKVSVPAGEHVVMLKIDWCRSQPVTIRLRPDEVATLECGPNATPLLALFFVTVLYRQYLWLKQVGVARIGEKASSEDRATAFG